MCVDCGLSVCFFTLSRLKIFSIVGSVSLQSEKVSQSVILDVFFFLCLHCLWVWLVWCLLVCGVRVCGWCVSGWRVCVVFVGGVKSEFKIFDLKLQKKYFSKEGVGPRKVPPTDFFFFR